MALRALGKDQGDAVAEGLLFFQQTAVCMTSSGLK